MVWAGSHPGDNPGNLMVYLVNSQTNATRIGWHLWEIDLRFAPGLPPGWVRGGSGAIRPRLLEEASFLPRSQDRLPPAAAADLGFKDQDLELRRERIFIELMTSDRKLKASSEGSK